MVICRVRYDGTMKQSLPILLISLAAIVQSGCSTAPVPPAGPMARQIAKAPAEAPAAKAAEANAGATPAAPLAEETAASAPQASELLMYALSMIGVKYKYGGSSMESGFDCSGFVRHVYSTVAAIDLPRSSRDMSKIGNAVRPADLAPGDLVFYNTQGQRFSHVGIYLGDNRFVHAPSSRKSVEIVDMNIGYWKRRFDGARRLLPAPTTRPGESGALQTGTTAP